MYASTLVHQWYYYFTLVYTSHASCGEQHKLLSTFLCSLATRLPTRCCKKQHNNTVKSSASSSAKLMTRVIRQSNSPVCAASTDTDAGRRASLKPFWKDGITWPSPSSSSSSSACLLLHHVHSSSRRLSTVLYS